MGSHFPRVTRMGSHIFCFFGVRQFFIFTVSKRTRMFGMKSKVFFIQSKKWSIHKNRRWLSWDWCLMKGGLCSIDNVKFFPFVTVRFRYLAKFWCGIAVFSRHFVRYCGIRTPLTCMFCSYIPNPSTQTISNYVLIVWNRKLVKLKPYLLQKLNWW